MDFYIKDMTSKKEKLIHKFTLVILIIAFSWSILPMLILRENYVFAIHDGLDSYAAMVQNIHDNHMYFKLYEKMPFMHGIEGRYTMMAYTIYDFLNCSFGYLWGQILTRIIGVAMGLVSLRVLLKYVFKPENTYSNDVIMLISIAYAITPVAPNRMLAYASLPIIIIIFLKLSEKTEFTKLAIVGMFLPLLSAFQAVYIFVLGFWFLFTLIEWIVKKKLNINLMLAFIGMCIVTIVSNYSMFWVALTANETNRGLYASGEAAATFDFGEFKSFLIYGQYHSTALHTKVILPILFVGTVFVIYKYIHGERNVKDRLCTGIIMCGWLFWGASAFIRTFQECGFTTGILVIDGYQWGESIALMRIIWYLMIAAMFFMLKSYFPWKVLIYVAVCTQLIVIVSSVTTYNDTLFSIKETIKRGTTGEKSEVTYKEFFDKDIFDEIKEDINYSNEGVAAYGYHPSVLMFNGFNTIDGYLTVHSMEWQNQFRDIIAPYLETDDYYKEYYDGWGGRMYIFGPLDFAVTRDKNAEPTDIYIDVEVYKKYGGKYVVSRAEISNAEEQGLSFIKDYDSDNGIYHMYLYEAK